ncbi:hypothetical protein [Gordonia sp. NPDC003376]
MSSARCVLRGVWIKVALVVVATLVVAVAMWWGFLREDEERVPNGMRIESSFAGLPSGAVPTVFDTGQPAMNSNMAVPVGDRLQVINGTLTFDPTSSGAVAGYLSTPNMGNPVTAIGAEWTFRPGDAAPTGEGAGAVALVVSRNVQKGIPQVVPPFALHLVVTPVNWNIAVKQESWAGELQVIDRGVFAKRLSEDGKGTNRMSVQIDGSRITLHLPDGNRRIVDDPRISQWRGRFATFELYSNHGTTDSRGAFRKVWAESGDH